MPRVAETIEHRVTRRFYARFKSECEQFSRLIKGVTGKERKQHSASLLLIRLMFVRFVQSKGLLEGDTNYLRSKLVENRERGRDGFYSQTLCPLFTSEPRLGKLFSSQCAKNLRVPDDAFERVFDFFDQYRWRLEEGPPADDGEITPDCMGRILELSINQKQMGAYYTRDDITEHIARNTIIPYLFDSARRASESDAWMWRLLQSSPDRYIYGALKKGAEAALASEHEREMIARRKRLDDLRAKLARGEVRDINEVVTCNLDIRRFAQDVVATCASPRALVSLLRALESITVLDLTCGSGAFLFAALNILEPLYEACLDRAEFFLSDAERSDDESLSELGKTLDRVGSQKKRSFILKAIISNNLFGVDIMQEAVEICRMRFFLKLLARSSDSREVESLLEIDLNIRAGNALVGLAAYEDEKAFKSRREMDRRVAREFGTDPRDKRARARWLATVKPFHWPAEFPEIIRRGGFDAIIGNPPYVSAAEIRKQYAIKNYRTANCPDIYAWVLERACDLLRQGGRSGQIVPLSLTFSRDFDACRNLIFQSYGENWFSSFARIPSALFNFDVRVRNTIHIGHKTENSARSHTTRIHRWFEAARPHLFEMIEYAPFAPALWQNKIPKLNTRVLSESFERCIGRSRSKVRASLVREPTAHALHFKRSAYNWLSFCRRLPPCYDRYGRLVPHTKASTVYFADGSLRDLAFLLLNGKIMLAFWSMIGDDFDLTEWMFADFPLDLSAIPEAAVLRLLDLADELERRMDENVVFKLNAGKRVGNCNLAKCREVTDRSDRLLAEHLGIEDAWAEIELLYDHIVLTGFDDARKT